MGDDSWMFRPRRRISCTGDVFCSADNRVSLRDRGLRTCSPRFTDPCPRLRAVVRSGLKSHRIGRRLQENLRKKQRFQLLVIRRTRRRKREGSNSTSYPVTFSVMPLMFIANLGRAPTTEHQRHDSQRRLQTIRALDASLSRVLAFQNLRALRGLVVNPTCRSALSVGSWPRRGSPGSGNIASDLRRVRKRPILANSSKASLSGANVPPIRWLRPMT